jgi:HxlR-like helix-turn-helix
VAAQNSQVRALHIVVAGGVGLSAAACGLELNDRGISPNTLSARLKNLEERHIVIRRMYEEHPPRAEYRTGPQRCANAGRACLHPSRCVSDVLSNFRSPSSRATRFE